MVGGTNKKMRTNAGEKRLINRKQTRRKDSIKNKTVGEQSRGVRLYGAVNLRGEVRGSRGGMFLRRKKKLHWGGGGGGRGQKLFVWLYISRG